MSVLPIKETAYWDFPHSPQCDSTGKSTPTITQDMTCSWTGDMDHARSVINGCVSCLNLVYLHVLWRDDVPVELCFDAARI